MIAVLRPPSPRRTTPGQIACRLVEAEHTFAEVAAGLDGRGDELLASVQALAGRLAEALPDYTEVVRSGGGLLGRGERRVEGVKVEVGGTKYALALRDGQLVASCRRDVGGIAASLVRLTPGEWLAELEADLRTEAARSLEARHGLARLRS